MTTKINFYRRRLPDLCIDFSSTKGKQIFKEALDADCMNVFFTMGPQLRTQDEPAYCGLSSLVIILNALAVDPGKVWKGVWRWYHEDMLECCTSLDEVKVKGVTMEQLSCIARCNQLECHLVHADKSADIDIFRNKIKAMCKTDNVGIVASFSRKVLGQTGTRHFAPIGGFHPGEDLVLILEPARFKYSPFWVSLPLLWEAMKQIDPDTGKARGYLILTKSNCQPTLLFQISKALNAINPVNSRFLKFLKDALQFLKQKHSGNASPNDVLLETVKGLLKISDSCDNVARRGLFFTSVAKSTMESLSPEHQEAIGILVQYIESTKIYGIIRDLVIEKDCCGKVLFDLRDEKATSEPPSCAICFPHYATILMYVLPVFSPGSSHGQIPDLSLSSDDYEHSYLQQITMMTCDLVSGNALVDIEVQNAVDTSRGQQLLLNEIDQLRTQVFSVLRRNKGNQSCCGK